MSISDGQAWEEKYETDKPVMEDAVEIRIVLRQPCPNKDTIVEMCMEAARLGFGSYSNFDAADVHIKFTKVNKNPNNG